MNFFIKSNNNFLQQAFGVGQNNARVNIKDSFLTAAGVNKNNSANSNTRTSTNNQVADTSSGRKSAEGEFDESTEGTEVALDTTNDGSNLKELERQQAIKDLISEGPGSAYLLGLTRKAQFESGADDIDKFKQEIVSFASKASSQQDFQVLEGKIADYNERVAKIATETGLGSPFIDQFELKNTTVDSIDDAKTVAEEAAGTEEPSGAYDGQTVKTEGTLDNASTFLRNQADAQDIANKGLISAQVARNSTDPIVKNIQERLDTEPATSPVPSLQNIINPAGVGVQGGALGSVLGGNVGDQIAQANPAAASQARNLSQVNKFLEVPEFRPNVKNSIKRNV